jgi:RNA ligase
MKTHASEFLDYSKLPQLVAEGLITRREHPDCKLFIHNYSARCQHERIWTPETMACRGLILDAEGFVVSRCLAKFFNLSEAESPYVPSLPIGAPFEAYEKYDGSMGISFRNPMTGYIEIATRGAFASEQALWASAWWREHHGYYEIPDGQSWIFEIIFPENRVCVNYGNRAELVLLAVIDNATGQDLPFPENWSGTIARRYDASTVDELIAGVEDPNNFEGFVLRYPSTGQRCKCKLNEYVRLHKILTECSSKVVWELLSSGQGLSDVLDRVPSEFARWVNLQSSTLLGQYQAIIKECEALFPQLVVPGDRKATALAFVKQKYPPVLFKMLDGKEFSELVWKMVRPEYAKPFVVQHETAA